MQNFIISEIPYIYSDLASKYSFLKEKGKWRSHELIPRGSVQVEYDTDVFVFPSIMGVREGEKQAGFIGGGTLPGYPSEWWSLGTDDSSSISRT